MRTALWNAPTLSLVILLLFGFSGLPDASGQIGRLLKNKLKRQAEQAADKAITEAIDRAIERKLDELFAMENRSVEVRGDTLIVRDSLEGSQMVVLSEAPPADPEPSPFIGSFHIEVASYKKDKMEKGFPMTVGYYIDTYAMAMEMNDEKNDMTLIIDRKAGTMTSKMEDKRDKKAVVMPLRQYRVTGGTGIEDAAITPTDETRQINGYTCTKFIVETSEDLSDVWATEDLKIDLNSLTAYSLIRNNDRQPMEGWDEVVGFPLLIETTVKGEDIRRVTKTTSVEAGKVDKEPFSLKGYEVQEIPSFYANRVQGEGSGSN